MPYSYCRAIYQVHLAFFPVFIVMHALLIAIPHYLWLNHYGGNFEFFLLKSKRIAQGVKKQASTRRRIALSSLYKALVLLHLDYCSSVCSFLWCYQAAGVRSEVCGETLHEILVGPISARLSWPSLSSRRSQQKVTLCRRIPKGKSILQPSRFSLNHKPNPRHFHHDQSLLTPFAKTTSFQSSFLSVLSHSGTLYHAQQSLLAVFLVLLSLVYRIVF